MTTPLPALTLHPAPADPAGDCLPLAAQFAQQLGLLHGALRELSELASAKLAAIRRADAAALQEIAGREGALLNDVFRGEQERKAMLARLAQQLHCAPGQRTSAAEIAARLPEPLRSTLQARSAALRESTIELQRKNRLAAEVARSLQSHLRGVFAAVAGASRETLGYGPRGQEETTSARRWVDAVG